MYAPALAAVCCRVLPGGHAEHEIGAVCKGTMNGTDSSVRVRVRAWVYFFIFSDVLGVRSVRLDSILDDYE